MIKKFPVIIVYLTSSKCNVSLVLTRVSCGSREYIRDDSPRLILPLLSCSLMTNLK